MGRKSNSASNLLLFVFGHTHPSQLNGDSGKKEVLVHSTKFKAKVKLVLVAAIKAHFVVSGTEPAGRLAGAR